MLLAKRTKGPSRRFQPTIKGPMSAASLEPRLMATDSGFFKSGLPFLGTPQAQQAISTPGVSAVPIQADVASSAAGRVPASKKILRSNFADKEAASSTVDRSPPGFEPNDVTSADLGFFRDSPYGTNKAFASSGIGTANQSDSQTNDSAANAASQLSAVLFTSGADQVSATEQGSISNTTAGPSSNSSSATQEVSIVVSHTHTDTVTSSLSASYSISQGSVKQVTNANLTAPLAWNLRDVNGQDNIDGTLTITFEASVNTFNPNSPFYRYNYITLRSTHLNIDFGPGISGIRATNPANGSVIAQDANFGYTSGNFVATLSVPINTGTNGVAETLNYQSGLTTGSYSAPPNGTYQNTPFMDYSFTISASAES